MIKPIFNGREIVLITKHRKEDVIKPIMEQETGCDLIVESGFDTDELGTFTREIKRPKSQLETAKLKIINGLMNTKYEIGIASEGSFGMHPYLPIPWNTEIVLLYDKAEGFEVYGKWESSDTNYSHIQTSDYDEILRFAENIGFPKHYLIMRPEENSIDDIFKGIHQLEDLKYAFEYCSKKSHQGTVFLETDMRAFANPTRMENIKKATLDLVQKLKQVCPNCGAPGFVVCETINGLPCELCGTPTYLIQKELKRCYRCQNIEELLFPNGRYASARYCNECNP